VAGKNRVAVQCVVHDVADEKNGREREGQQHARAMRFPVVMFDTATTTFFFRSAIT
jgi:hypothetical protein